MLGFPLPEFIMLVLGFGFLIFVHELGHFAVAKWVGIRCPQFAIGFGKAMFSWRKGIGIMRGSTEAEYERRCIEKLKADGINPAASGPHTGSARYDTDVVTEEHDSAYTGKQMFEVGDAMGLGETEYRLNYLPLGGYVKMLGQEDMDPNAKSDDPNAYNNKPIWARACVISAGVVMNMIFGAIFLAIAFLIGVEFPSATVGQVIPGMPAATTYADGHDGELAYLGLREGDLIKTVNGKEPEDFKDVAIAVALGSSEQTVELVIERRGLETPLTYHLKPERQKSGEKLLSAGFAAGPGLNVGSYSEAKGEIADWIRERYKAAPVAKRETTTAIRITEVNGEPIETYAEYRLAFDKAAGKSVQVTMKDPAGGGASKTFAVPSKPTLVRFADKPANLLGMVPAGKITLVAEESPAEEAKMQIGDILKRIGDVDWPKDTLAVAELIAEDPKKAHRIVVMRDGKEVDLGEVQPNNEGKLGIVVEPALDTPIVAGVLEGSAAALALDGAESFMPGTKIVEMGGKPLKDWAEIQATLLGVIESMEDIGAADSTPIISFKLELPVGQGSTTEEVEIPLSPEEIDALSAAGWSPEHSQFFPATDMTLLKAEGLGDALAIGMDKTGDFVMQTYITLLRLIQGNVKIYNLRGPVGIVSTGTQVAEQGFPYLLFFLGLISVNLAVINFLPIPIVDGGHMVFLAWEKITGSPPSEKVQVYSLYAGLAVIGFVFIATFYFDVMREISRFF